MEEKKDIQEEDKKNENTPRKNSLSAPKDNNKLIIILIIIIALLVCALVYMLLFHNGNANTNNNGNNNYQEKKPSDNKEEENKIQDEQKQKNEEKEEEKENKKYELTVYKYKYDGRITDDNEENQYVEEAFRIKVSSMDAKVLSADNNSLFVVYKDNGVKIYNVKTKGTQAINLQDNFKEYSAFANEAGNKLVGIVVKDNTNNIGYYNVSSGKLLYYGIKYKGASDNELPLVNQINDNYLSLTTDNKAYLLNANKNSIELSHSFPSESEVYYDYQAEKLGDKYVYFLVESNPEASSYTKVFNSNLKEFYSNDYISYSIYKANLYIVAGNEIKKYNASGEVVNSYNGYTDIVGTYENYVIYTDNNSKLILQNIEDKSESKELAKVEKNYYIWYNYYTRKTLDEMEENNKKEGLYVVIEYPGQDSKGNYGIEYCYTPTGEIIEYPIKQEIGGRAKPVLYLYPEKEMNVSISFAHPEYLTTTYPKYINSWNVTAKPNGDLTDKDGKYYYALYWDEKRYNEVDFNEGFYVEGKDAIKFLEEKLSIIGLNDKERNEFIMYWLPIMENNKKNLVYFELTNERELGNKLIIEPKPDSLLRVSIHIKKVSTKTSIKEQKLESFKRYGFTAVEWGGMTY